MLESGGAQADICLMSKSRFSVIHGHTAKPGPMRQSLTGVQQHFFFLLLPNKVLGNCPKKYDTYNSQSLPGGNFQDIKVIILPNQYRTSRNILKNYIGSSHWWILTKQLTRRLELLLTVSSADAYTHTLPEPQPSQESKPPWSGLVTYCPLRWC